jgi:ParB family transcriptional regulator, chromosome partitioning protein
MGVGGPKPKMPGDPPRTSSPYLRSFVIARVNPLRFMKEVPTFNDALDLIVKKAAKFNVGNVKQEDIAASASPMGDEEG